MSEREKETDRKKEADSQRQTHSQRKTEVGRLIDRDKDMQAAENRESFQEC